MPTYTLKLEVTPEEHANLLRHFTAATDTGDPGPPRADIDAIREAGAASVAPVTTDTDEHGVPWCAEHHSSVKKLTVKGHWKRVRGGDKKAADEYERLYTAPEIVQPPAGDIPPLDVPAFLQKGTNAKLTPPAAPATPAMPPVIPQAPVITYDAMMDVFTATTERVGTDKLMASMGQIYADAGVTDPNSLNENETQRAAIVAALNELV